MNEPFSLKFCETYIHLTHRPGFIATPEAVAEMWPHFAEICEEFKCSKLLIEAHDSESQLDTMAAFDAGRQLAETNRGISVAFYLPDLAPDDTSAFFKTVALNRGARVELFSAIDEAVQWLITDD